LRRAKTVLRRLPSDTPLAIRELVQRCLDRDVKRRLRDIGEARIAIDRAITQPPGGTPTAAGRDSARAGLVVRFWRVLPWSLAAAALVVAAILLVTWAPRRSVSRLSPFRLTTEIGADASLFISN